MSLSTQRNSLPALCFTWKERRTEEEWYEFYRDDFDDGSIGDEWTEYNTDANRTITEAADLLTIHIDGFTDSRWISGTNDAPKLYQDVPSIPFEVIIKMPAFALENNTDCGVFIGYHDGDWNNEKVTYKFQKRNVAGSHYIQVNRIFAIGMATGKVMEVGSQIYSVIDESDVLWFKIYVDAGSGVSFFVSDDDGLNWHQMTKTTGPPHVWSGFFASDMEIGPFASATAHVGAVDAEFDYFLIRKLHEVGEFTTTQDCVSFIDARAPEVFYSGRVKSMSSLRRAIDDKTGLYKIADMSVVLANNDRKYSRLATSGILKNQEATLVHIWTDQSEAAKLDVIDMVVEDQSLKGEDFRVKLKDITQKYFSKKIPGSICTEADFPNIHPDHIGRYMPEILGHNVIGTGYEKPGAVEAVYVNTAGAPYQYLASRGQLHSILNVYSEDALLGVGDWAFVAGPPSLINITPDQGDNRITFDANGYMTAGWNSTNGYIQNLPYIIQYLLETLMEMPATKVDATAFDALAIYFEDQGWDEDGFLILQKQQDAMEVLRQLLFTAGIKGYVALGGNFTAGIKDTFNYEIDSLDAHVFSQLELLNPPERLWNLPAAINTIKARYGYIPWQQLWFGGAIEEYKDNFYDAIMEDDVPIHQKDRPLPV